MPITQPPLAPKTVSGRTFRFAREAATWGVAGTVVIDEPFMSIDPSPQQEIWENNPETGTTADSIGQSQATHYEQLTVRLSSRVHGFAAYATACMMGPITYTPPATPPGVHSLAPHPTSNLLNTFSIWYKVSGEGSPVTVTKQYLAATPGSVHFTFTQNADLACEVQLSSLWPSSVAPPAASKYIGADAAAAATDKVETHLMSTGGTFTIIGSSGVSYNTRVQSGDVTLTRTVAPVNDLTTKDVYYLKASRLSFQGNLTVAFDGYGAGTVEDDFRNHKPGGTFATPNILRWTDDDGNYIEFVSYPWYLTAFALDHSGQWVVATISFRATNDPTKVANVAPVLTLCNVNIKNNSSIALVSA